MAKANSINAVSTGLANFNGTNSWSGDTVTNHAPLVGGTGNAITSIGPLTDGQLVIGSTGGDPVAASLSAGSGITITPGSGTITIAASGGSSFTWSVVTGTTQAMAVNNGYIANNAGQVVATLPATSAVGDTVAITGINNDTGWRISQNAGNQVFFGTASTTSGTGGHLDSASTRDTIYLVCMTANATWNVVNSIGNITVV